MRSTLFLVASATAVLATSHAGMAKQRRSHTQAAKRATNWQLETFAKGNDFLNFFDFTEGPSDNGGMANWVSQATAEDENLVWVNPKDESVHLRMSTALTNDRRDAIKLVSKSVFNDGLLLIDIERQPQVCGIWPSVWLTSMTQQWPAGGEIDLVEYVSRQTDNAFSVHTSAGCWAGSTGYTGTPMLAGDNALNCDADATASQGCGFRSSHKGSGKGTAGMGANWNKGGVYALSLGDDGVKAWFFPRGDIPSDISAKSPNPSSWGTPDMYIAPDHCNPSTYFQDLGIIIQSQASGTWAEGVWSTDNSYAGQTGGSCAAMTGYTTAADYVRAENKDFKHAYWKFRSLSIYKAK